MLHRRIRIKVAGLFFVCNLMLFGCSLSEQSGLPGQITFSEHIAPIVHSKCSRCHMEGEAAPFPLITYEDVFRRAQLIRYMVNERLMPPWPADPEYRHFANEWVLEKNELELINRWVDQNMPPGDSSIVFDVSAIRNDLDLGKPDLIVTVPSVAIKGNNQDLFLLMKIPVEFPQDTYLRAVEFVPGNKRLVHHVNTHLVLFDASKKQNMFTGKNWVNQDQTQSQLLHKELGLLHDDGSYPAMTPSVSNYLPGSVFSFYPPEIGGYRVHKKSAFYLNDLHYGPSPIDTTDLSYFKIYYSAVPPKRPVLEFQMGTLGIAPVVPELIIPPDSVKTFTIQTTLPDNISLVNIVPHMHLLGKSYTAYAVKPSGDTIPLIRIPKWDFRWQYFYTFTNLIFLPRGTRICVEGVFDNTSQNPNNPFSPPREVREREGSMKTTDEMFQLIVTYVPYQPGDEHIRQQR